MKQYTDTLSKELAEELQRMLAEKDKIEEMIDELKAKEKDGGLFVVLQQECYTTTN